MSLKAFHILFISLSTLMFLILGIWLIVEAITGGTTSKAVLGVLSIGVAVVLVMYGRAVLRKLRHLSFL